MVTTSLDQQRVHRCMDDLTELQRESIKLAYYSGYSYPQVATAARGGARHGEDTDQGRIDQDARLHGGDLVKNMRDDLHVLTGSYVLERRQR